MQNAIANVIEKATLADLLKIHIVAFFI